MTNVTGRRPVATSAPPYGAPPTHRTPASGRGARSRGGYDRPRRPVRRTRRRWVTALIPWMFLAPALLLFVYFKLMPLLQAIRMSFYDVRPYLGDRYVGFGNYVAVTTQPLFTKAIWQTVVLAVGTTGGSIVLGFLLAILVEGQARHLWLVRTAAFLPVVTTMAVVAEVWRIMYYPGRSGALNTLLGWVGLGPEPFLAGEHQALASVMLVGIWRGAPYDMMIFLAGLASVDRNLYEAAAVDGGERWQRFRHVTLPSLRPVITILCLLAALRGLRSFTEVFLLTNGAPNGSSEVIMTLIYKLGVEQGQLGVAAAGSMLLFLAIATVTLSVNAWRRRVTAR